MAGRRYRARAESPAGPVYGTGDLGTTLLPHLAHRCHQPEAAEVLASYLARRTGLPFRVEEIEEDAHAH